uniref:Uncharacterized protein n=1 Tax=Anopheles culicifacies TaxID=139723 RepID=A0A182MPT3_9DIPT
MTFPCGVAQQLPSPVNTNGGGGDQDTGLDDFSSSRHSCALSLKKLVATTVAEGELNGPANQISPESLVVWPSSVGPAPLVRRMPAGVSWPETLAAQGESGTNCTQASINRPVSHLLSAHIP